MENVTNGINLVSPIYLLVNLCVHSIIGSHRSMLEWTYTVHWELICDETTQRAFQSE